MLSSIGSRLFESQTTHVVPMGPCVSSKRFFLSVEVRRDIQSPGAGVAMFVSYPMVLGIKPVPSRRAASPPSAQSPTYPSPQVLDFQFWLQTEALLFPEGPFALWGAASEAARMWWWRESESRTGRWGLSHVSSAFSLWLRGHSAHVFLHMSVTHTLWSCGTLFKALRRWTISS